LVHVQENGMTAPQLKARIRSLQYRQRTLQPRKDALREMIVKLDDLRNSGEVISANDYDVCPLPAAHMCLIVASILTNSVGSAAHGLQPSTWAGCMSVLGRAATW
jgi:hypothetical protein